MKRKPNLFIVGAPKCGTTALATWLGEHPDVYFSPKKEPYRFYCPHGPRMSQKRYEELFAGAKDERIVAEGSVWYLFSPEALRRIRAFNPDARIVVCLRNPAEVAVSLHAQMLVSGIETVTSFEEAWSLRDARRAGRAAGLVSMKRGAPEHAAYDLACQLGTQLQRLYGIFPREQVHTVLLDDVRQDPEATWASLLTFLGLAQDGRQHFPVVNPAEAVRYTMLQTLIQILWQQKLRFRIPFELGHSSWPA